MSEPQSPGPSAIQRFLQSESTAGILLMAAAALALLVANSPAAGTYFAALHAPVGPKDLQHWVNDGLMAVFFLLVGLEIKREVLEGELSTWPLRLLPGMAALGGMAVPALVYLAFQGGGPGVAGWAIPAATDIAFALGVLSLLGSRAPQSLKVFLTALAIIDDLGAVLIIAVFYTHGLTVWALGAAAAAAAGLVLLNRLRVMRLAPYLALGAALWWFMLQSGVHATLAGVILALTIPRGAAGGPSPLTRLEHGLHPWVAFAILPVFGFCNAGVSLAGVGLATLAAPIPFGVAAGLFVGKQVGVFGAAWLAVKTGLAAMPAEASWRQIYGVSVLCGIGFTISLFIGLLAFEAPALQDAVKLGVLVGSALSALLGWAVLRSAANPQGASRAEPDR